MDTIERVKKIILSPKTEWQVIDTEETSVSKLLTSYLVILAMIPAIGWFIGYGLVGHNVPGIHMGIINFAIRQAVISFLGTIGSAFLTAYIINWLAPRFGSKEDFNRAFRLVVYSYTPMCVAGILYIFPALSSLAGVVGLYSLYILYLGIAPMMKTPEEKITTYFLSTIIFVILIFLLISMILGGLYF